MNTTKLPDELRKADEFDIEFMDFFEEKNPAPKKPARSSRPQASARQGTAARSAQGASGRPAQGTTAKRPAQPKTGGARSPQGSGAKRPAQGSTAARSPQVALAKRPAQGAPAKRPTQGTAAKRPVQQRPSGTPQAPRAQRPSGTPQAARTQRPVTAQPGTSAQQRTGAQSRTGTQPRTGAARPTQGAGAKRPPQQRPVSAKQTTRPAPKLQHPSQGAPRTARPAVQQPRPGTQRPSAGAQAKQPAKQKEKAALKPKSRFKKGFLISWAAFTLILIAALILLTIFLSNFEKGRPTGTILHIVRDIQEGDLSELHLKTEDGMALNAGTILYDEKEIADYILRKAEGKDTALPAEGETAQEETETTASQGITYRVVNAESDETKKVYLVKAGDEKILKVCIERSDKKYLFGFTGWEETESVLLADSLKVTTLRAQIPHDSQLSVNGTVIGRDRIVSEGDRISLLSRLIDIGLIGEQPGMDTYEVPGIYFRKEVKLTDAAGIAHDCTEIMDVYTGGFEAPQDFVDSQYGRVIDMFEPYALYFSGERGRNALNAVMVIDSPAYNSAVSADVSWMQEHSDVEITEKKAENFKQYSDQVFSCDISFLQTIYQGDEPVRTWDTNMTWIFIWDEDNYYVADFVTRAADEG